jgi:predicted dehydrogenase
MNHLSRRSFLKSSALAAAGVSLSARSWAQVAGANSDVRVAVVGLHGRGKNHISSWRELKGVRLVALCDCDTEVLDAAAARLKSGGLDVQKFVDLRELLARSDIDAISIATPNHQHSLQGIWACQAGKDAYVEKPVSHNVWEGRQLVAAAAKYNRIVQAGMQCRSSHGIAEAVAWVRAGNLGKITAVRGLCYKRRNQIGKTSGPQPVPSTVNYDLWLGPAAMEPPRRKRFHYDWHWFWATGNGDLGNQGVHQVDLARWFLGAPGQAPRILSFGGRLGYVDDAETPNTQVMVHDYAEAPLIFEVRGLPSRRDPVQREAEIPDMNAPDTGPKKGEIPMDSYRGASIGVVVHCEGGYVVVPSYSSANAFDKAGKPVKSFKGSTNHFANFIDCVRSRKAADLKGQIIDGHHASALCHTGNISYRLGKGTPQAALREQIKGNAAAEAFGRMAEHLAVHGVDLAKTPVTLGVPLAYDLKTERFTGAGADKANPQLSRAYRKPFAVPAVA